MAKCTWRVRVAALAAVLFTPSCDDSTRPLPQPILEFATTTLQIKAARDTSIELSNTGEIPVGPIQIVLGPALNTAGDTVTGPVVTSTPELIATLNPGTSQQISLGLAVPLGTPEGSFVVALVAETADISPPPTVDLHFTVSYVTSVIIVDPVSPTTLQGDVLQLAANAFDINGDTLTDIVLSWTVAPEGSGFVSDSGAFVAYAEGTAAVIASAGGGADTIQLSVTPRSLTGSFTILSNGSVTNRFTSDLWVHGTTAYTGTWATRTTAAGPVDGNTLNVWDVTDPASPILAESLMVDARVINDVKISADGLLGVISHEGSSDLMNGITLLDLTDPLSPSIITRVTSTLETGVHNAWLDGSYLYVVVDGSSSASGLRILNISDPANPTIVAQFYGGSSFLHDVYVRDGLAFLSHWNAGLIILDVGNGIAGGSPESPVEVSRIQTQGGQTHNAWYWPNGSYVFVGEEDLSTPGIMHVVNVSDMSQPQEVATFRVPNMTPHNFWMDEIREIIYLSWYSQGIRALDVSGQLLGELDLQGREIVGFQYAEAAAAGFPTSNWAPQLHGGLLYLSDMNTGLWVLRPEF